MDDGRAGEVREREFKLSQPATSPSPPQHDRVDQGGDEEAVNEVAPELRPFGHGARNDGGGGGGESGLEEEERRRQQPVASCLLHAGDADVEAEPPAEQLATTERDAESDESKRQDAG